MRISETSQNARHTGASDHDAMLERRLSAVSSLRVLDRIGDPVLVSLTRLLQSVTGASAAAVHIFDARYQRRVAATGAPLGRHPAQDSMCRLVIEDGTRIVCADAVTDSRFSYSSFIRGHDPVRFYASLPLRVNGETPVGTLCAFDTPRELSAEQLRLFEDIGEVAQAHLTLVEIATHLGRKAAQDGLTRATTRVMFDDALARALGRQRLTNEPVLVVAVDLDDFKAINDTYGHARGDAALCWVAARLRELLGSEGTVGRIGGDEFAVLSERIGREAEELVTGIRGIGARFDPPFRVSVGSAFAGPGDDVPAVMRRADQRMYGDKARGRAESVASATRARAGRP
jgi:diguanylate cyclase (GGDEF)-like protein